MRKNSPLTTHLASVLVASLVTMGIGVFTPVSLSARQLAPAGTSQQPQQPAPRPTLVVGIFVEGLTADYINLLRSNFGKNGFNRFIENGVSIENVDFGPGIDATAATAILMTGASPGVNGIPAARVWNSEAKIDYPILLDAAKIGNFTNETFSPEALKVSTVSDEIRISDGGFGLVHSVAPDAQIAIILAGHAGNSGFWINDVNGKWSTSTFYKDVPAAVSRRNYGVTLASRLDTLSWNPALPLDRYPDLPEYKKLYPFRHTFPAREPNRFTAFKTSAPANREIANVGIDYISSLKLGTRGFTDMLNLGFNVSPYRYGREADNRIETMDAYIRLDSDIANILRAIEKGPGMDHTMVFIAGTPAPAGGKRDEERWNIPSGQFSPRRAISLLNLYLMAIHGNGDYINGYHNGYFFLNHKLIKERGLNEVELRRESADFLARMSGVSSVYTIDDILARRAGDEPLALQRNTSPTYAGDLLVMVNPGWEISDGDAESSNQTHLPVVRNIATTSPVYILSPGLSATTIDIPVDARAIAPTITRLLRIRSPNAASLPPLRLKK
ncbi:MAG: alkaline phosphatase family protein [Muribaculaceae bacterium]|nr:alkaline phosphatase family protein [Muribaculaceae bacterium]